MGSAEEEATTETDAGDAPPEGVVTVGIVAGAVYVPFRSIVPQAGAQVSDRGFGERSKVFEEAVFACTSLKTAVEGFVLSNDTVKDAVCAGVTPTGTVAVNGVIETRMPESS